MKKIVYIISILVLVGIIFWVTRYNSEETESIPKNNPEIEYISYENPSDGPEFIYPKSWGDVIVKEGNKICPEEDTYRTSDTLHIYDREFSFNEIELPLSQSFIRTGVRTYLLDPNNLNSCGDDFHLKIARNEVAPEALSSFVLNSVTIESGLSGTKNRKASYLNTEARAQYTFFVSVESKIQMIQTYMSFIPHYNSLELKEMEEEFGGDINEYIEKGETSKIIRKYFEEFTKMTVSLSY